LASQPIVWSWSNATVGIWIDLPVKVFTITEPELAFCCLMSKTGDPMLRSRIGGQSPLFIWWSERISDFNEGQLNFGMRWMDENDMLRPMKRQQGIQIDYAFTPMSVLELF
jgi:hypothetical protein